LVLSAERQIQEKRFCESGIKEIRKIELEINDELMKITRVHQLTGGA
jgi:hypothetical protein